MTFFSLWPCRMIFAFSHLLTAVLIGPWQYLLLFCSQPFAALSNHSGSLWAEGWGCISLSLACSNWGCCISQRNVRFLPPPRRWLSLLLKELPQISQADQKERSSISYLHMYMASDDEDSPFVWSYSITSLLVVYMHK